MVAGLSELFGSFIQRRLSLLSRHQRSEQRGGGLSLVEGHRSSPVNLAWLMSVHKKIVYAGIWSVLKGQDDLAEDGDLSRDVDYLAYQCGHGHQTTLRVCSPKAQPGSAPAFARKAWSLARTWKTQRLRHKARYVNVDADLIDKKSIVHAEREKTSGLSDEARIRSNPPKTRAMLCSTCETVKGVSSASGELSTLVCGHSRGLSVLAKDAMALAQQPGEK